MMQKFEKTISPAWFQRSPIDICPEEAYYHQFPAQSNPYPAEEHPGVLEGHHFQLKPPLEVEVLGQQLRLVSIHFHSPSEHHLSGHEYPLELHMVHEIVKPTNGSTKFVIGVWFASERSDDCRGAQFLKVVCAKTAEVKVDLSKCLPEDTSKFFRYEGSLTTGSYDEDVSWMVMHDPVPAPDRLLKQLEPQPDIPPTPINRRYVLRSYP